MIPVKVALTFDRVAYAASLRKVVRKEDLDDDERVVYDYLDAAVESGVYASFDGGVFDIKVPERFANERIVSALSYEWELGGWLVGVFAVSDDGGERKALQVVFAPSGVEKKPVEVAVEKTESAAEPVVEKPRVRVPGAKPRVLLISDVPGWAFDQNMRDLERYLSEEFDFEHFYTENWFRGERPDWNKYDAFYEAYHRNPPMGMPMDRALGALRSQWFKPEKPLPPDVQDVAHVNKYRGFQVAAKRNYDELAAKCPHVVYLTNPVDTRRFRQTEVRDRVVASWNGNARHKAPDGRYIKGYYDIAVPAAVRARVPLVAAEYNTTEGPARRRTPEEMPAFYQQANVALSTSEYEAACGVGETMVVLADGSRKRLDQIVVGDRVLARDGSAQVVEKQWCEGVPSELVEITTWGGKKFKFTKNHRWPVWAWLRECLCGCGEGVTQGRLWAKNHSGSLGRKIKSVHAHGSKDNTSSSYRAIPPNYEPKQKLVSEDIRVGDFLMIPRKYVSKNTNVTQDEARLLGYYTAEGNPNNGWTGNYAFTLTFNTKEKDTWVSDSRRILNQLGVSTADKISEKKHTHQLRTVNGSGVFWRRPEFASGRERVSNLVKWLRTNAGEGAKTKQFSEEVMSWPLHLKRELIIGLYRGDGHQSWKKPSKKTGSGGYSFSVCYGTASPMLCSQVQLILAQLGYPANIVYVSPRVRTGAAIGFGKNRSDFYHVVVASPWHNELAQIVWGSASLANVFPDGKNPLRAPKRPECMVDDDFCYLPVKSVRVVKNDKPVYNLTVSGDHSYLVDNVATFNSNSVMESMSSGLALLATDVGNHRELRDAQLAAYGDSGIMLVERNVDAFAEALRQLTPERAREMGEINRREIETRWSWEKWAPDYAKFLRMAL